jgi:hypothetical protein
VELPVIQRESVWEGRPSLARRPIRTTWRFRGHEAERVLFLLSVVEVKDRIQAVESGTQIGDLFRLRMLTDFFNGSA